MYSHIEKHPSTADIYRNKLKDAGIITEEEVEEMKDNVWRTLNEKFEASKDYPSDQSDWLSSRWSGFFRPNQKSDVRETGVPRDELKLVGESLGHVPESVILVSQPMVC